MPSAFGMINFYSKFDYVLRISPISRTVSCAGAAEQYNFRWGSSSERAYKGGKFQKITLVSLWNLVRQMLHLFRGPCSCEKNEKHKKIPSINSGPVNFKKYKTLDSVETNPSVYWIASCGVFSLLIKQKNYWKMKTVRKFSKIAAQNFFEWTV